MIITNPSVLFTQEQLDKIENLRNAVYVCATEHKGHCVEVFYGAEPHPVSQSRYFGLYKSSVFGELMITNGAFIEDQEFDAVIADNGEVIYSRYRHDYRTSKDGSVWIDGGRSYTRSGIYPPEKRTVLVVRNGELVQKDAE